MSDRTFRAVVASVLVGALVLAVVVVITLLPRPTAPVPTQAPTASPVVTTAPSDAPTSTAGPAFGAPEVVSVGTISRGSISDATFVLRLLEPGIDAIPNTPGSFRLTLFDNAGDDRTVSFVGEPSVTAPGTLGATAVLVGPNVLMVNIASADTALVELMTISGLGIRASPTAAIGPVNARLGDFSGSLAGGVAGNVVSSPGTVVAGP